MRDGRIALKKGTKIMLDKEYTIKREIGRGASCIVYEATYKDAKDLAHIVRIKEFFPFDVLIERENDKLVVNLSNQLRYEELKKHFEKAYEKNVQIKKLVGLMNYTVDSLETFSENNTIYSIMTTIEGEDYEKYQDADLTSIFSKARKLCSIINKYHEHNYLHLDIKPANILITEDSMYLLDFDSIICKDELDSLASIRLSCSQGFSAPELMMGAKNAICEATDVFSVGAIIFYKMFDRVPELRDRQRNASYNYDEISSKYEKVEYCKKFYEKMTDFFHKTLASAPANRYSNMKELSVALQQLEEMTNKNSLLVDNFRNDFPNFVGRKKEIEEIEKAFENTNFIFLSGMGGIGKTELAKKVASKMKNEGTVDRVAFLNFENNLKDTICSSDLLFTNWEDGENSVATVDNKIKKLREVTARPEIYGGDLIIVDNFDDFNIENELEVLLQLVNCKAKFIFTTREENHYRDLGYKVIQITELSNLEDLLTIFQLYNTNSYSADEVESIFKIIEFVDRHTMTVDLIAKYLRHTGEQPSNFYEKLLEKEGITNTDNSRIIHRKKVKMPIASVNQHLLALFDLSQFNKEERELLACLSFLGPVKIKRSLFAQLLSGVEINEVLEELIAKGWVEANDDKISLHQIILDLIFNYLIDEEAENVNFIKNLCTYCEEKSVSFSQKKNKERLIANVIERIPYKSINVGILCLKYFQNIKVDKTYLMKAAILCEQRDEIEWLKLKLEIICEEIKHMLKICKIDLFEESDKIKEYFKEIFKKVQEKENQFFDITRMLILKTHVDFVENSDIVLELDSYKDASESEDNDEDIISRAEDVILKGQEVVTLLFKFRVWKGKDYGNVVDDDLIGFYYALYQSMRTLEKEINNEFFWESLSVFEGITALYHETEQLLDFILEYTFEGNISYKVQEEICSEAIEFFGDGDYCEETRFMVVGNLGKSTFYNEKLKQLYKESTRGLLITDTMYYDASETGKFNGDYDEAYMLVKKAFEKKEITEDIFLYEKAEYLSRNEKYESALNCLKSVLTYDELHGLDPFYTNKQIIDLYSHSGQEAEALNICKTLLVENISNKEETDDTISRFLYLSTKINELNKKKYYDSEEFKIIETKIKKISNEHLMDADLFPTYMMYFETLIQYRSLEEAAEWLFVIAEKCRIEGFCDMAIEFYSKIVKYSESIMNDKLDLYVKSLLWLIDLEQDGFPGVYNEGMDTCEYVKTLLEEHTCKDWDFCQALLLKIKTRFYLEDVHYPREDYEEDCRKCDYYLLTERALQEGSAGGRVYNVWEDCFKDAMNAQNKIISLKALNKMTTIINEGKYIAKEEQIHDEVDVQLSRIKFSILFETKERVREEILCYISRTIKKNDYYRWKLGFTEIRDSLVKINELVAAIVFSAFGILYRLNCSSDCNKYIHSLFDEKMNGLFLKMFFEFLPEEIEEDDKDEILEMMEFIIQKSDGIANLKSFNLNCQSVMKRYRCTDVEFKR